MSEGLWRAGWGSRVPRDHSWAGYRCASWFWGRWCNGYKSPCRVHWLSPTPAGGFSGPGLPSPSMEREERWDQVFYHIPLAVLTSCPQAPSTAWERSPSPAPGICFHIHVIEIRIIYLPMVCWPWAHSYHSCSWGSCGTLRTALVLEVEGHVSSPPWQLYRFVERVLWGDAQTDVEHWISMRSGTVASETPSASRDTGHLADAPLILANWLNHPAWRSWVLEHLTVVALSVTFGLLYVPPLQMDILKLFTVRSYFSIEVFPFTIVTITKRKCCGRYGKERMKKKLPLIQSP